MIILSIKYTRDDFHNYDIIGPGAVPVWLDNIAAHFKKALITDYPDIRIATIRDDKVKDGEKVSLLYATEKECVHITKILSDTLTNYEKV
jgi:hypothetical protein